MTGPGGRLTYRTGPLIDTWPAPPLSTPVEHAAMARRAAAREAVRLIAAGRRGRAEYVMTRSVMSQARMLGVGHTHIGPSCGCGRADCPQAVAS